MWSDLMCIPTKAKSSVPAEFDELGQPPPPPRRRNELFSLEAVFPDIFTEPEPAKFDSRPLEFKPSHSPKARCWVVGVVCGCVVLGVRL